MAQPAEPTTRTRTVRRNGGSPREVSADICVHRIDVAALQKRLADNLDRTDQPW